MSQLQKVMNWFRGRPAGASPALATAGAKDLQALHESLRTQLSSARHTLDDCLQLLGTRQVEGQNGQGDSGVGIEVESLDPFVREGTGPYPEFLAEAQKLGMDVNDYTEQHLGWPDVVPLLERMMAPRFQEDSTVCELGPGLGRWSRHLAARLPRGSLHLVDYSPWFVRFLEDYFRDNPRVQVSQTDGFSLPLPDDSVDLIVSCATFVMLKAGVILSYARDFHRVLRPGGQFVLEYLDLTTPEGQGWCETFSQPDNATVFTYHSPETMAWLFESAGLEIVEDNYVAEWFPEYPNKMLVGRRP